MIAVGSADMTKFWLITQNAITGVFEVHNILEPGNLFTVNSTMTLTNDVAAARLAYHKETNQIAVTPSNSANIEILLFTEGAGGITNLTSSRTVLNSFQLGETFGGSTGWSFTGQFLYFSRNNGTAGNIFRFNSFSTIGDGTIEQVLANPIEESLSLQLAPDSLVYHIYRCTRWR